MGAGEGEGTERVKLAAHFLAPGSCEVGGDRPATCFVQNSYVAACLCIDFSWLTTIDRGRGQPTSWPKDAPSMNMCKLLKASDVMLHLFVCIL